MINDQLPDKLSLCLKVSTRADADQKRDADNLKTWNKVASLRSQFPRLLHYCNWKMIAHKERSVLLVEACGDGTNVGTEMKRIAGYIIYIYIYLHIYISPQKRTHGCTTDALHKGT